MEIVHTTLIVIGTLFCIFIVIPSLLFLAWLVCAGVISFLEWLFDESGAGLLWICVICLILLIVGGFIFASALEWLEYFGHIFKTL